MKSAHEYVAYAATQASDVVGVAPVPGAARELVQFFIRRAKQVAMSPKSTLMLICEHLACWLQEASATSAQACWTVVPLSACCPPSSEETVPSAPWPASSGEKSELDVAPLHPASAEVTPRTYQLKSECLICQVPSTRRRPKPSPTAAWCE
jgi:hypothetical protein